MAPYPSDDVLNLHDVLFVPSLTKNLQSVSTITELRYKVEFDDLQCTIKDCSQELPWFLPKRVCEVGLYRVLADTEEYEALVHDSGKLWYKCLGYLHYGALTLLKDMVHELLDFKIE